MNPLERAFNLPPKAGGRPTLTADTGTSGLPLIRVFESAGGRVLSIQYLLLKAANNPGLTQTPQFSSTLGDIGPEGWVDFAGSESSVSIDADRGWVTVEVTSNGYPRRFGRVKVTKTGG